MGLSKREFAVLLAIHDGKASSQRDLAAQAGVSLGTVNNVMKKLREEGLADGFVLTEAGEAALAPYKVDNAIIMAADLSSRFVPLSYERPKGVLRVRGEALIERKIRQLKEAGVNDITVVVGYMKEALFCLEDAFGVKIRVNEQHASRNNNSTLMLVREQLGNTYICSSDDSFTENVFRPYVYEAYYAATHFPGKTDEYCMKTARDKVIYMAFAVCCAFLFGDHLSFTANFQPSLIVPVLLGKLAAGICAIAVAHVLAVKKAEELEAADLAAETA